MKKLFSISFILLAFGYQSSAIAQSFPVQTIDSEDLVENFCEEAIAMRLDGDDEIAEMVRSYIAELNNPSIEQIVALSQIAVKVENGYSLRSACD